MLDKTDPIAVEQSLLGFFDSLGILTPELYTERIEELVKEGKIRYSDHKMIESVFKSPDGQYQLVVLRIPGKLQQTTLRPRRSRRSRHNPNRKPSLIIAYYLQIYPETIVLNKKEYENYSDLNKELKSYEAKRLNLRQHKTTINTYAETLPPKIAGNLGCQRLLFPNN